MKLHHLQFSGLMLWLLLHIGIFNHQLVLKQHIFLRLTDQVPHPHKTTDAMTTVPFPSRSSAEISHV